MPAWDVFKKRYAMEPGDLGNQSGFTIAMIEKVDSDTYTDRKNVMQVRHQLYFVGYEYPLRLNNTRVDVLKALFGPDTENASGKKVALLCAASASYGETEITINIHPMAVPQDSPLTPVRHDVACRDQIRRRHAELSGVTFTAPPAGLTQGHGAAWTQQGAHPAAQLTGAAAPASASGATLGKESAAKLLLFLRERKRDWDFLVAHLRGIGLGAMVEGKSPPDCDAAIKGVIWKVIKDLPVLVEIEDRAKAEADLIEAWTPPAPGTATVVGLDGKPLEVPVDDIPF